MEFGAEAGIWKITQAANTLKMSLWKYGKLVEEWESDKPYSFEELFVILSEKSYEKRGDK